MSHESLAKYLGAFPPPPALATPPLAPHALASLASYFGADAPPAVPAPPPESPPMVQSSADHAGARRVLTEAWRRIVKRDPTAAEIQAVQAIALHETGYGQLGPFSGSHNWGGVQVPGSQGATECGPGGFLWHDTTPRPDGSDERYSVCFRTYADDVAGASDVVRNLTATRPKTFAALATGDADRIAGAMYIEHYYEEHGKTPAERIARYAQALSRRAADVAHALHEPLVVRRGVSHGEPLLAAALPLAALFAMLALAHSGDEPEERSYHAPGTPLFTIPSAQAETGVDIFPTFVTGEDAKRYVNETDAAYQRLDQDIRGAAVPDDFKSSWGLHFDAWKKFRDDALKNAGFFNAKAVMEQTDRWAKQLADWRESFTKTGGKPVGPAPPVPGQGVASATASAGWIQVALLIASLFGLGYLVRGFRGA